MLAFAPPAEQYPFQRVNLFFAWPDNQRQIDELGMVATLALGLEQLAAAMDRIGDRR